jgi:hypothetical protein
MVKQFSNGAIDNAYTFIFKWVDFGKMLIEFLWSFVEIWLAFFMIFYNIILYFYYLLLYIIDFGSEEGGSFFRFKRYKKAGYMPRIEIPTGPNPISPKYGIRNVTGAAMAATTAVTDTAAKTLTSLRTSSIASGAKRPFFGTIFEGIFSFFIALGSIISAPFKKIVLLFDSAARNRSEKEKSKTEGTKGNLIDDYIKEYEQRRK